MAETLLHTSAEYYKKASENSAHYYYVFKVYLVSQSIQNNTSSLRITQEIWRTNNTKMWSTNSYGPTATVSYSLDNGTTYADYTGNKISQFWVSGQGTRVVSGTTQYYLETVSWPITISHASDGTRTIKVKSSWNKGTGTTTQYYPNSFNLTAEDVTLPTIPRSSELASLGSFTIDNTTGSLSSSYTVKATFYHDLYIKVNGTRISPDILTKVRKTAGTYSYSVPYTTLLAAIPTSKTGALEVVLETFSGSGSPITYTSIGSSSKTVSFSLNESNFKPSVTVNGVTSAFDLTIKSTKLSGYFVGDGTSKASASYITSSPSNSGVSWVRTYIEFYKDSNSAAIDTKYSLSLSGELVSGNLLASTTNYSLRALIYAVDSRGIHSSRITSNVSTVYGYLKPSIIVSNCYRTANASSTTEDTAGEYVYILFTSSISSLSQQGNSIQSESYTYTINETGATGSLTKNTGNHFALDDDQSAKITLTITDKISTQTVTVAITKAFVPFEIYDPRINGSVGVHTGFAFKEVAEADLGKFGIPIKAISFRSDDYYDASNGNTATFHGTADSATSATNAVTSTNSNNQAVTESNPSDATTYFPSFYSARTGNLPARANNGLSYYTKQGTASALGFGGIKLGNTVNQGTAGNKWGFLDIYPQTGAYYCRIRSVATLTGNRTINFPDASGTAMLVPTVLWEPDDPTTVGQGGKSISVNCSAYSYIRVWAHCYDVCFSFNVDLRRKPTYTIAGATGNNVYRGSGSAPLYTTGANTERIENYYCMVQVNSAKTSVSVVQIGYIRGSSARENRNENVAYYVYRIEGFL